MQTAANGGLALQKALLKARLWINSCAVHEGSQWAVCDQ
jgi:hypothetical protein